MNSFSFLSCTSNRQLKTSAKFLTNWRTTYKWNGFFCGKSKRRVNFSNFLLSSVELSDSISSLKKKQLKSILNSVNGNKLNFFLSAIYRLFFSYFRVLILFVYFFLFNFLVHLPFRIYFFSVNKFYFLPSYQKCLKLFLLYRRSLLFIFAKQIPFRQRELAEFYEKCFFHNKMGWFYRSKSAGVYLRYRNLNSKNLFSFLPIWHSHFNFWRKLDSYVQTGSIWRLSHRRIHLFSFFCRPFLSVQAIPSDILHVTYRFVNLGSVNDVTFNFAYYYYFFFFANEMPTEQIYKKKLFSWFQKKRFFFYPRHNVLLLPNISVSRSDYLFKYAPPKSIDSPIRFN